MRIAYKLLLGACTAFAVTAIMAGTASAQETTVVVVQEPTGTPCLPCDIHLAGESQIISTISGATLSVCQDEFEGTINASGTGSVSWTPTAHGAPGCNLVNCTIFPQWGISNLGELGSSEEHLVFSLCIKSPGSGAEIFCDVEVLVDGSFYHHYDFSADGYCAGGARIVEGSWSQEAIGPHDEVEFIHFYG